MNNRPPTITAISVLYIVVGLVSTSYHLSNFKAFSPTLLSALGTASMIAIGAIAVVAGYYMLRGKNWARWLAFSWTIFHVFVSALQSPMGLVFHSVFVLLLGLLLFSKEAKAWFTPQPIPVTVTPPAIPPPTDQPPSDPPPPVD